MRNNVYHSHIFQEFLEPSRVEVFLVEKAERFRHRVLGNHVGRECSIRSANWEGVSSPLEIIYTVAELMQCLLYHLLLEANDHTTREVGCDGCCTRFVKVMFDSVSGGVGMTKLLGMPLVFIQGFEVIKLIVERWIIDMQFVWINADDWPCLV